MSGAAPGAAVPPVEVVVPVHQPTRPVGRAVASVLRDPVGAGAIVVAHGLDPRALDAQLGPLAAEAGDRLRVVRLDDGRRSPAGPFNHGIDEVRSEWFAIMGSDDWLEEGALSAWLDHARRAAGAGSGPDVVLAPLRHQSEQDVPTPLPRHGRTAELDVVRDRLLYRTAPLGLLRTAAWRAQGAAFDADVARGVDMETTALLWSSPEIRVDYARHAPRYVIGADATDRVTLAPGPLSEVLHAVRRTAAEPRLLDRPHAVRRALAIKLARIHLMGVAIARTETADVDALTPADAEALHATAHALTGLHPGWPLAFTAADRRLLEACADPQAGPEEIRRAARRRREAGLWARNVPRAPWRALDRESTLVRYLLTARDTRAVAAHRPPGGGGS